MCFFPFPNNSITSPAYKKGVREFKCGGCPECLSDRARSWALRCSAQAEVQPAVMVTLTYDEYVHDTQTGKIIGERVSPLGVDKKDAQKFIKRLREYFHRVKGVDNIKYLITAEYGKRTHRAHYHAILFGITFDDCIKYKKSKRGNWIYKSPLLDKLWAHGICTVDSANVNAKIARYCTKYCAKDGRTDDTFMLFSRGIGIDRLLEKFNGKNYIVDGREYTIPRAVWIKYIERKYNIQGFSKYKTFSQTSTALKNKYWKMQDVFSKCTERLEQLESEKASTYYKYEAIMPKKKPLEKCSPYRQHLRAYYYARICKITDEFTELTAIRVYSLRVGNSLAYQIKDWQLDIRARKRMAIKNDLYRFYRDNDSVYKRYLKYWQEKAQLLEQTRAPVQERINALPNAKYFGYKQAAMNCLSLRNQRRDVDFVLVPRSNCLARYIRKQTQYRNLPCLSRYNTANDRRSIPKYRIETNERIFDRYKVPYGQLSIGIYEKFKDLFDLCLT